MADKDLKIKISGDASGFGKASNEVTRQINGIRDNIRNLPREAIRSAGAQLAAFFSVGFLVQQSREVVDYAGAISDMAARVGVATEFLQQADYAARQTGASLSEVVVGLRELMRSQSAALSNRSGSDANAFAALGVSIQDLKRMGPEELFRRVARAIQEGDASGRQMEAAIQILGRSAASLLPAMRQGFSDLADRAREIGIVIEDDLIEKLDAAGDAAVEAALRMRSGWALVVGGISDGIIWLTKRWEALVQGTVAAHSAFRDTGSGKAAGEAFSSAWAATMEGFSQEEVANAKARAESRSRKPVPEASLAKPASSGGVGGASISTDALQRIGLFINGSSQAELMRRQLTVQERLLAAQREALAVLRRGLN